MKMRGFKPLIPVSTITLLLLGMMACRIGSSQNQAVSVREIKELDLEVREDSPLFLSPDGQHIAWLGLSELCIYDVSQQTTNCYNAKSISDELSLRWSPDSNYLAYTESYFDTGHDADIWIFDLQNGTTSNLTDDNIDANPYDEPSIADVLPQWFANSQDLAFVRYDEIVFQDTVAIFTISRNGEQPIRSINLGPTFPHPTQSIDTYGDNLIAVTQLCDPFFCRENQSQEIVVVEKDNIYSARSILSLSPKESHGIFQLQFSATGDYLSACNFDVELRSGCKQIILRVNGRINDIIELPEAISAVIWSPTTNAFLTINNEQEEPGLYFYPEPGKDGTLIQPGQYLSPTKVIINGLTWASSNTIILLEGEGENTRYWLLSLKIE